MRIRLPRFPRLRWVNAHLFAALVRIVTVVGIVIIVFMLFRINAKSNRLAQTAKELAEQNQVIAKLNGQHIDCLADLFAKYTREARPITIEDLDQCKVTSAEAAALISGAVDFTPPTMSPPAPNIQNTNISTKPIASQEATQKLGQGETAPPPEKHPPVEVLGVPVCVPDPLGLIDGGLCVTH